MQEFANFSAQRGYAVVSLQWTNNHSSPWLVHPIKLPNGTEYIDPRRAPDQVRSYEIPLHGEWDAHNTTSNPRGLTVADGLLRRVVSILNYSGPAGGRSRPASLRQYLAPISSAHPDGIRWNRITVSGHSLGSGMATFIAKSIRVSRVVLFSGVDDFVNIWYRRPHLYPTITTATTTTTTTTNH